MESLSSAWEDEDDLDEETFCWFLFGLPRDLPCVSCKSAISNKFLYTRAVTDTPHIDEPTFAVNLCLQLSHLDGKTMECMINDRLVWYIESCSLITEAQSGFRKTRSTMDHLVRFEAFVREGFLNREHVVSIFFDFEKAYDTTWKYGIMIIYMIWTSGEVYPFFIQNFLSERTF